MQRVEAVQSPSSMSAPSTPNITPVRPRLAGIRRIAPRSATIWASATAAWRRIPSSWRRTAGHRRVGWNKRDDRVTHGLDDRGVDPTGGQRLQPASAASPARRPCGTPSRPRPGRKCGAWMWVSTTMASACRAANPLAWQGRRASPSIVGRDDRAAASTSGRPSPRSVSGFVDEVQPATCGAATAAPAACRSGVRPTCPKGGPDGGDGGAGGDIWLVADRNVASLLAFRDHPHRRATNGAHGQGKKRHGAAATTCSSACPEGTVVHDQDGEVLADLVLGGRPVAGRRRRPGRPGQRPVPVATAGGRRRSPSRASRARSAGSGSS